MYYCGNTPYTGKGTKAALHKLAKRKRRKCRKKYCARCLIKFYRELPSKQNLNEPITYLCPSCRDICTCASCRRRRDKNCAINAMVNMNNNSGVEYQHQRVLETFSPVSDTSGTPSQSGTPPAASSSSQNGNVLAAASNATASTNDVKSENTNVNSWHSGSGSGSNANYGQQPQYSQFPSNAQLPAMPPLNLTSADANSNTSAATQSSSSSSGAAHIQPYDLSTSSSSSSAAPASQQQQQLYQPA